MEWHYAFSRAGKASEGCDRVPVGLVLAMWEHASTRANDVGLHGHVQIFNVGVAKDGKTRAIDSAPIFHNQGLFTAYYRAKLAAAFRAEFGIEFEVDREGLRMCGIPRELVRQYSKRRQVIANWLAERGESGAAAAARAALATRKKKDPLVSRQELFRQWQATNTEAGFDDKYVAELLRHGPRQPRGDCREVIQEAVRNLTRQTNHFSRYELLTEVLALLPKYGLQPDLAIHAVDAYLSDDAEVVDLGTHEGERRFTVDHILEAESRLLYGMDSLASRPGKVLYPWEVERELKKHPTLSPEQIALVRHLTLTNSAVRIGLGLAGTGKTHAVRACVNAWKRKGYRVLVAAPTGQAARVLGRSTGADGETLTKVLGDFRLPPSAIVKHHARQLLRTLRHKRTWRIHQPRPAPITANTIVLVDEAGMIGLPHATKIAQWVEHSGATLCFIGDPAQLPAIESTSPLQALARRYGAARVTDIRRQKDVWARVAAQAFADGDPAEAMEIFAAKNKITIRDTTEEVVQQACLDWTAEGLLTPHRAAILVNTNDLVHTVNQRCQEHRLRANTILDTPSTRITDENDETVFESRVYVGDRVLFTKNSRGHKGYGVDNGSLGTVMAISPLGSAISVSLDDGRCVTVDTVKFPHIRLGYAMTTHKAQGASIPNVFVLIAGNTNLQNLPASYVQGTRAIESTHFYTTKDLLDLMHHDLRDSPLIKKMSRRPDLRLATELLQDYLSRPLTDEASNTTPETTTDNTAGPPQETSPETLSEDTTKDPIEEATDSVPETPEEPTSSEPPPDGLSSEQPSVDPSADDEQAPDQPQEPDEARERRLAYRMKQLRARYQAWQTHGRQERADAEQRKHLTAESQILAKRQRLQALRKKRAEFEIAMQQSLEAECSPAHGYQRLRMPAETRLVGHDAMLQASCVDGGSTRHRNRLPPPPGHAMLFASDCIHVQRVVPVPSRYMTLAEASQGGSFRLEGTGCADYVRVVCPPHEQWLLSVDGPLGLISPQDDIQGAIDLYDRPAILRELTRLDQIQHDLCRLLPAPTLLLSLFACLRREASWLLPNASHPDAVARKHLERFCHMVFTDLRTQEFLDWFQSEHRPVDTLGIARFLNDNLQTLPHRPPKHLIDALGHTIATGESWQTHYQQCIEAIHRQFTTPPSPEQLYQAVQPLEKLVQRACEHVARQHITPERQKAVMEVLFQSIGLPVPTDARFHPFLTHTFQLTHERMEAFPPAHSLWMFATANIRGLKSDAFILHRALRNTLKT